MQKYNQKARLLIDSDPKRWNHNMDRKQKLVTLLLLSVLARPCLATNQVWNIVLPSLRVAAGTKFPAVALRLEQQSRSLDPSGRGIRIVCPKWPDDWNMDTIFTDLTGDDLPLASAVRFVAKSACYEVRIVDDVALCCRRQTDGEPRYQTGVLRGRITDREGHPLTNATFTTDWLMDITNQVWITTDGSYVAAITYVTRRPYIGIKTYEREDDMVPLIVGAPGHEAKSITADLSDAVDPPFMEIKLKRKEDSNKPNGE